jgi:hypothetical protein
MPPCMDVYVWLPACEPEVLSRFIDLFVTTEDPADRRLWAFVRAYVERVAEEADWAALAELSPSGTPADGFSLYLPALEYAEAIITITREGAVVLGLSIDDPDASPEVYHRAETLIDRLRTEFAAPAGRAGTELAPARSRPEWDDDASVQLRAGSL